MSNDILNILNRYYNEANKGLRNDKPPSALKRGEGTEKEYYIFKIDLVKSTFFLANRLSQTYLKLAHVFLSSVDEITRIYGSDASQVEYAGDSVLAYFDATKVDAFDVLMASYWSREAVLEIKNLDPSFKTYNCKTKIVLHFGKLILAKIGPWGDYRISAIGKELHRVAKLEKKISGGIGHATKEFGQRLDLKVRRKLLRGVFETKTVDTCHTNQSEPTQPSYGDYGSANLNSLSLGMLLGCQSNSLAISKGLLGLGNTSTPKPSTLLGMQSESSLKTEKVLTHWEVCWPVIHHYINGKIEL